MLYVITGPSCVGKTTCVFCLCKYHNFQTIIGYTTRMPRQTEEDGYHYYFSSEDKLRVQFKDFKKGYWARPLSNNWYGFTSDSIDSLATIKSNNWIVQANVDVALEIKKNNPAAVLVFLDFNDDEVMESRIQYRFGSNQEELGERIRHGENERKFKSQFDYIFESDVPETLVKKIIDLSTGVNTIDMFISYSSLNLPEAKNIHDSLLDNGLTAFLADKSLTGGDQIGEEIRDILPQCKELCVLVTPESTESKWVIAECAMAWGFHKRITPILYECKHDVLPPFMSDTVSLKFHQVYGQENLLAAQYKERNQI